jgi:hypothetical protein
MTGERTIFLRRPAASSASSSTKDPGRGTLRLAPWRPLPRILSTEARTRTWRNFKNFGGVAAKTHELRMMNFELRLEADLEVLQSL